MDHIIRQATAKEPSQRLPSVAELRRALERLLDLPEAGEARIPGKKAFRRLSFSLAVLLAVLVSAGMAYHFISQSDPVQQKTPGVPSAKPSDAASTLKQDLARIPKTSGAKYVSRDGAVMHYVPGGNFRLIEDAGGSGRPVTVAGFFMDENEVTNHQFVQFLNQRIADLKIEKGVVKHNEKIWLFLGEVKEGYEPIVSHNGTFMIRDPALASYPVVRVTAQGAAAYALYYGKRLPTVNEWLHAAQARHGADAGGPVVLEKIRPAIEDEGPIGAHNMMRNDSQSPKGSDVSPSPVGRTKENEYGIKGLDSNVSEWVVDSSTPAERRRYFIVGGLERERATPEAKAIERNPFEAFGTVGFRTAADVEK